MPNSIARVALFRDPVSRALGGPVVEVCAVAKRDLKAGETLDDYGEYMTYGEAVAADEMSERRLLPEGLVEGCVLRRDVAEDEVITYDDVDAAPGRRRRPPARRAVRAVPRRDVARRGSYSASSAFRHVNASAYRSAATDSMPRSRIRPRKVSRSNQCLPDWLGKCCSSSMSFCSTIRRVSGT